jgi:translation initiation factor IF-2
VRLASANKNTIIVGFNTKIDTPAKNLADRDSVKINVFDIIYKLTDSLKEIIKERAPKVLVDEITGTSKIIRIFSKNKDKQIIGGKVENGLLMTSEMVKIMRRENEVGTGRVRGLQSHKKDTSEVSEGSEFGAMVESKIEIAPGDRLVSFRTIEK